ncbi:MAG: DNA-directed RNA polymerase subunit beta', partial [Alphaproteobacteria bacterium]|nr:DNA-directed RNA polymerase subunit beta' [Alphaproteobacteria bacterium]
LTCQSDGLCAKCYGMDLSRSALVHVGEAVGVIAGQAIGEPGTQLTLRTFHVGGIATGGAAAGHFIETHAAGTVKLDGVHTIQNSAGRIVVLSRNGKISVVDKKGKELFTQKLPYASMLLANDGAEVEKGAKLAEWDPYSNTILAEKSGRVKFNDLIENVSYSEDMDATTGITTRKVANWKSATKKSLSPSVSLVGENGEVISLGGKKVAEYMLPMYAILSVADGQDVHAGDVLARIPVDVKKTGDITGGLPRVNELLEVRRSSRPAILAEVDGEIEIEDEGKSKIIVRIIPADGTMPVEYAIAKGVNLLVRAGDIVKKADQIVDGDPVPQDILRILGQKALAQFMVEQIQQVYRLQGVTINNKHVEILIREMTRRVEIVNPGDTVFLTGNVIDRVVFEEENERVIKDGGRPAEASRILVGLTRASLTSRSFISNASFQQTTKVLVDAAIGGSTDKLVGINENLMVGRLIPVGTGAYVRRVREIAKEEEKAERLLAENAGGEQQMLAI